MQGEVIKKGFIGYFRLPESLSAPGPARREKTELDLIVQIVYILTRFPGNTVREAFL